MLTRYELLRLNPGCTDSQLAGVHVPRTMASTFMEWHAACHALHDQRGMP